MTPWGMLAIIAAYLIGLLATGVTEARVMGGVSVAGGGVLLLSGLGSAIGRRFWRLGPTARQWWIAGMVGLIAASYCIARSPQPANDDISRFASQREQRVLGMVLQMPQTSRNDKGNFLLQVQSIRQVGGDRTFEAPKPASGKLYVTAALAPSKRLYPGELVELKGKVYTFDSAREDGRSGFGEYLSKQGCFAGFRTYWIEFLPNQTPPKWALWRLRQRIVLAQGRWLGEPAGNLLSAMTLGRKAVDLPHTTRDSFIEAGLAHTLAASGFHVSLILGLVLGACRTRQPRTQAIAGLAALTLYVGLTGLQPSVVRASVMGAGAMVGLCLQRQVKPLGCLLMAVSLILLFNPQWVWDVGFQLSATATLGLIVMVPGIVRRLDWLPVNATALLSVPIAAFIWTLPLQLHYFEVIPVYSVFLNAIATPLVILISVGGFISAIAAVVLPVAGSAIAANLYYPIHLLIWLVESFNQLPGSSVETPGLGAWPVVAIYSLYAAVCLWLKHRHKDNSNVTLLA